MRMKVGGGFFTGRYNAKTAEVEDGSRFDPKKYQGQVSITDYLISQRIHLIYFCRRVTGRGEHSMVMMMHCCKRLDALLSKVLERALF